MPRRRTGIKLLEIGLAEIGLAEIDLAEIDLACPISFSTLPAKETNA
jgi:hypothetical protein